MSRESKERFHARLEAVALAMHQLITDLADAGPDRLPELRKRAASIIAQTAMKD